MVCIIDDAAVPRDLFLGIGDTESGGGGVMKE
jgi:hypothetical protein